MGLISGYIGTYTGEGKGRGIYGFALEAEGGELAGLRVEAETANPSYLALSARGKYLYAVNELGAGGSVCAYERRVEGLRLINRRGSLGKSPCHIALGPGGFHLVVSNYGDGVLGVFPVGEDGSLGEAVQEIRFEGKGADAVRQAGPHAHFFMFGPGGKYGYACDLGTDRVMAYRYDGGRKEPLCAAEPPWYGTARGAGPRHGVFNLGGNAAYVVNELDSTVDEYGYEGACGRLEWRRRLSSLPEGFEGKSTAGAVKLSPDGKNLYVTNRGHDSIGIFGVEGGSGALEWRGAVSCGGKVPRDLAVEPSGKYLITANQEGGRVVVFRRGEGGLLEKWREYEVPSPVCVVFG